MRVTDWTNLRNLPGQSLMETAPPTISMTLYTEELKDIVKCLNRSIDYLQTSGTITSDEFDNFINFTDDIKTMALNYGH